MSKSNSNNNNEKTREESGSWSPERMQQAIHAYLNKRMSRKEEDAFWEQLVEQPEFFKILRLEATLHKMHDENNGELPGSEGDNGDNSGNPSSPTDKPPKEAALPVSQLGSYGSWLIAVAAILSIVVAVNLLRVSTSSDQPQGTDIYAAVEAPLTTIDELYFESIDAYRDEVSEEEFTRLFDEALLAAFSREDERALELYNQILQEYPDDERTAMVQLNAGIIHYNNEAYEEALQRFSDAGALAAQHDDAQLQEKALWLRANTQLQQGEVEQAYFTLQEVAAYKGSFEADANELLHMIEPYIGE